MEILSEIRSIDASEFETYFMDKVIDIFMLIPDDILDILEEQSFTTLNSLRFRLFEQLCVSQVSKFKDFELRSRKYTHTIATDICYIGKSIAKNTNVPELFDILKSSTSVQITSANSPAPTEAIEITQKQWSDILEEIDGLKKVVKRLSNRVAHLEKDNEALIEKLEDSGWEFKNTQAQSSNSASQFPSSSVSTYDQHDRALTTKTENNELLQTKTTLSSKVAESIVPIESISNYQSYGTSSSYSFNRRRMRHIVKDVPLPPLLQQMKYATNPVTSSPTNVSSDSPQILFVTSSLQDSNFSNDDTIIYLGNNSNLPVNAKLLEEKQHSYSLHQNPLKLAREILDILLLPADLKHSITSLDSPEKSDLSSEIIRDIVSYIIATYPGCLVASGLCNSYEFARRFWRNLSHSNYMRQYRKRKIDSS